MESNNDLNINVKDDIKGKTIFGKQYDHTPNKGEREFCDFTRKRRREIVAEYKKRGITLDIKTGKIINEDNTS